MIVELRLHEWGMQTSKEKAVTTLEKQKPGLPKPDRRRNRRLWSVESAKERPRRLDLPKALWGRKPRQGWRAAHRVVVRRHDRNTGCGTVAFRMTAEDREDRPYHRTAAM